MLPGIDNEGVGAGAEIIRAGIIEGIAIGIEVQHAGERHAARGRDLVLDRDAGAPGAPHVVDNKNAAAAHEFIFGEL